ncbi:MAG: hypothetical protein J7K87_01190 [Candidatus Aenigmarchaeota archaeon]|nr:hypothetical protein [Candidatus Aenigmarchaeota archaeon]
MMVPNVHVFQIGYGKWGRIAFGKFVKLQRDLKDVNVILEGVCDINPKARSDLEKFLKKENLSAKIFSHTRDMYEYAYGMNNVLVYDASPSELHTSHILKSLEYGFFHFSEKPPYLMREEKKIVNTKEGEWSFDAIEEQNPVVLFAKKFLSERKVRISSVETFRYNSIGIKKMLHGGHRYGVQGGDVLDKAIHEIYLFDLIGSTEAKLKDVWADFFMIDSLENPKLVDIRLKTSDGKHPATAQSSIVGFVGEVPIKIHTGWLGIPELEIIRYIEDGTGKRIKFSREVEMNGQRFMDEELRLFIMRGEKNGKSIEMYGDMKNFQFFVRSNKWKEFKLRVDDQLYAFLKNAIYTASGKEKFLVGKERINKFSDFLFDAMDNIWKEPINMEAEARKTRNYVKKKLL